MRALELGDDALIAAQRLAQWCASAPELEEDVALANIALDQLGAARLFLSQVGDEDELAYLRDDREFRNCLLVELPNGDFAVTMAKLLFLAAYQTIVYDQLSAGTDDLAPIARKVRIETRYHLDHAARWVVRLGDGTEESHLRMQNAVDEIWPYTHELGFREAWLGIVEPVLAEATLTRPADGWAPSGGRDGVHTEHLSYLLAEMQVVHRAHPGATW
jgi:ring-1,2-phenylacetyl-CoA epoxidase subunit PaaC